MPMQKKAGLQDQNQRHFIIYVATKIFKGVKPCCQKLFNMLCGPGIAEEP